MVTTETATDTLFYSITIFQRFGSQNLKKLSYINVPQRFAPIIGLEMNVKGIVCYRLSLRYAALISHFTMLILSSWP